MGGSLNIDFEGTRTAGNNIKSKAEELKTLLSGIKTLNDDLKKYWTGDDATMYTTKITEQAAVMTKLQTTIEEIGTYLLNVSDVYKKGMNDNKGRLGNE